jgi:hypothetical protein
MSVRGRRWFVLVLGLAALVAGGALAFQVASNHVPSFYAEALDPTKVDSQPGQEMKRNVAALASDTLRGGRWRATFSDKQINSFLAVDLPEKHPRLLPKKIRNPRVSIRKEEAAIGWQAEGRWPAVYSLSIVPYVARPNVLAVRILRIRAGAIPVPLGEVVDGLTLAAKRAGLRLQWQQADGDPVALVEIPHDPSAPQRLVLDEVELTDGAIVVSGHTEPQVQNTDQASLIRPHGHYGSSETVHR